MEVVELCLQLWCKLVHICNSIGMDTENLAIFIPGWNVLIIFACNIHFREAEFVQRSAHSRWIFLSKIHAKYLLHFCFFCSLTQLSSDRAKVRQVLESYFYKASLKLIIKWKHQQHKKILSIISFWHFIIHSNRTHKKEINNEFTALNGGLQYKKGRTHITLNYL